MEIERRLALSDRMLLSAEKPERYLGNEINAVHKDRSKVRLKFAICFPDVYEIGMSHLGIQILYDMFNKRDDVCCERVYSPWVDMDALMREAKVPLFTLESQEPVRSFDFLGITLQYEMCYTNVLQILDLSGIPYYASDRTDEDPIVIGGGPCAYNPEPIADFFDLFYIGEGEVRYDELFDTYLRIRDQGGGRRDFLRAAARIPGIYVPSFYEPSYHPDGTLAGFSAVEDLAPQSIVKQVCTDLDTVSYPDKPLIPFIQITQDRAVLEVMRGCIRGCRFCQAGQIYKPVRGRSLDFLKKQASHMLDSTGQDEITLSSLSTSDYEGTGELVNWLIENYRNQYINISLPSLRIDSFSLDMMSRVQDVRKGSLTFACEAGSQRLRDVINKGITEEDIMKGSAEAFKGGWNKVKLYFMLGLPYETEEDILAIADLADAVAANYFDTVPKEERKGIRVMVNSSASFFVPKPFTPFQWAAMDSPDDYISKARRVRDEMTRKINHKSLTFKYHESSVSVLEGVFARGDRRLSRVILEAYKRGCLYDSWSDLFKGEEWDKAFEACGIDRTFYTERERGENELFPWDFIDTGVSKQYLYSEWKKAEKGILTENCAVKCSGCGASVFGCGICPGSGGVPAA